LPLYEYECPQDGRFELVRKFSDPPLTRCPTCGRKIEKLPSAPAIQFKGSGWYITDYARKSGDGKDAGADGKKDAAGKDTASKDSGGKDSGGKDSGGKDSGAAKESVSKEPAKKTAAKSGTSGGSSGSSD
jgi:putative FmdB family regulatory protein